MKRIGTYFYKGKKYGSLGECKIKLDGDWVHGVAYVSDGEIYIRLVKDFDEKFELIPYEIKKSNFKPKKKEK